MEPENTMTDEMTYVSTKTDDELLAEMEKEEAEKKAKMEEMLNNPQRLPSVSDIKSDFPTDDVKLEEIPAVLPKKVLMLKDLKFTKSMPSRADIAVTINLKEGQIVADERLIKHLLAPGLPVKFLE